MADYRRIYEPGGMYFFTVVTHRRRRLFSHDKAREYLRASIRQVRAERPFEMVASVLLPDHWPHSSFHRWVKGGYYRADWLCDCHKRRSQEPVFASIETAGE